MGTTNNSGPGRFTIPCFLWGLVLLLAAVSAPAQDNSKASHLGYAYPAGAQAGTSVHVLLGGQNLRAVDDVLVSGEGLSASVVHVFRPFKNLKKEQRLALVKRLKELKDLQIAETRERGRVSNGRGATTPFNGRAIKAIRNATEDVRLPDHPALMNLEELDLRGLQNVTNVLLNRKKRQPNAQLAESVLLGIRIAPDTPPGWHEIRLLSPLGITNPVRFQVGVLPEANEEEPNEPVPQPYLPAPRILDLPVVVNGQILPGDVDRIPFHATKGQHLVIHVEGRELDPYLADAVPGWFQPVLAIYNSEGCEVAYNDDDRFRPDPLLYFEVPDDGVYEIEIHDSIYRGREDFVYRVSISEQPYITSIFPLGTRAGTSTRVEVFGYNLPESRATLTGDSEGERLRTLSVETNGIPSNGVPYAVDTLPEVMESEPNDASRRADSVKLPCIVNGRVDRPGDVDFCRFKARAGDEVVVDVEARRLGSSLDSLVRLLDKDGTVIGWNDDFDRPEQGLLTHHADSHLRATVPSTGTYFVRLSDVQQHGGLDYAYRLRIATPQPDFALRVVPSELLFHTGESLPVTIHAIRFDGFDGPIDLHLSDSSLGFSLNGAHLPADRDSIRVTITAPPVSSPIPYELLIVGTAEIDGASVIRHAVAAEDRMQAFIYRHLVPAESLTAVVTGKTRKSPYMQLADSSPVRIPEGGLARVQLRIPPAPLLGKVELSLDEAPEGLTLSDVKQNRSSVSFALKAEGEALEPGQTDNLIVKAFANVLRRGTRKGGNDKQRRVSIGVLPAIPIEIVGSAD